MDNKIKFIANACRWFDRSKGNTYHSVRVLRTSDGAVIACAWTYGYGDQYKQTALIAMSEANWLPDARKRGELSMFERNNNYPIDWNVSVGSKRDMVANGKLEA